VQSNDPISPHVDIVLVNFWVEEAVAILFFQSCRPANAKGGKLSDRGKRFREIDSFGLLISFDHQPSLKTGRSTLVLNTENSIIMVKLPIVVSINVFPGMIFK
jgi:hypothetical protein